MASILRLSVSMPHQCPIVREEMSSAQRGSAGEQGETMLTLFLSRPRRLPWLLPDLSPSLPSRWVSLSIQDVLGRVWVMVEGESDGYWVVS